MRFRMVALACGLLLIGGWLVWERNRYNVVSHAELLTIREKLNVLSLEEKQDLAFFIGQAISFDQYPYTLVDYKPMSITNVIVEDTEDLCASWREDLKRPRHQALRRGYLVWEKYQALFPREKHILIDYSFLGKGRREIAVICPKLCMAAIQAHLDDFREILGKPCTSEEVFWILTHPEHNDFYTMIDHTRLVGILLDLEEIMPTFTNSTEEGRLVPLRRISAQNKIRCKCLVMNGRGPEPGFRPLLLVIPLRKRPNSLKSTTKKHAGSSVGPISSEITLRLLSLF